MSAACPENTRVHALLAKRADDSISAVETRALKAHLLSCTSCAEEAAADDPTLLFIPLSASGEGRLSRRSERQREQESASARADAERVVADVLAAVEVERSRRRLEAMPRLKQRRALLAASLALVGAGLLGWISFKKVGPVPSVQVAAHVAPATSAVHAAALPAQAAARPVIEDLANPGATVYEFASASPQEPTVVFIVDRNADI